MKDILKCLNFKILIFCIFVLYGSCNLFAYCEIAGTQTRYDYRDGVCWAYHCASGSPTWLGSVSSSYCSGGGTQPSGCKLGDMQYKPDGECETIEQSCCYNYKWSGWGKVCPNPGDECTSLQCWNGSSCTNKPSGTQYDGKCYYTCNSWQCQKGSGWKCTSKIAKKTQKGTWTVWGDVDYSGNKPVSTCSNRAVNYMVPSIYSPSDELAITICNKHVNGMQATPDGTSTWSGSCTIIGGGWCINYGGTAIGDAQFYCNTGRYKYQVRTVKCTEYSAPCA